MQVQDQFLTSILKNDKDSPKAIKENQTEVKRKTV